MTTPRKIIYLYPGKKDAHGLHYQKASDRAEATKNLNIDSETLDVHSANFIQQLTNVAKPGDIVFAGRNGYDARVKIGKRDQSLYEALGLRTIASLADHPFTDFMTPLLLNASPATSFLGTECLTRELEAFYPELKSRISLPWELIATPHNLPEKENSSTPYKNRDIEILAPLGLNKFSGLKNVNKILSQYSKKHQELAREIFIEKKSKWSKPILEIFIYYYKEIFNENFDAARLPIKDRVSLMRILSLVDWAFRYHKRLYMLRAICESCGNKKVVITASPDFARVALNKNSMKSVHFVGEVHSRELEKLYGRTQVVLNANPGYESLVSERVRHAISAGCVILTDESSALNQAFTQNKNILYFNSEISDSVLSQRTEFLEKIGKCGQDALRRRLKNHTFAQLLNKISLVGNSW